MSVKHVIKDLIDQVLWKNMKEFTQENYLLSARLVRKDSDLSAIWRSMKETTLGKNPMNVTIVAKHSSKGLLWYTIWKGFINQNESNVLKALLHMFSMSSLEFHELKWALIGSEKFIGVPLSSFQLLERNKWNES